jgi:hypothetical protein
LSAGGGDKGFTPLEAACKKRRKSNPPWRKDLNPEEIRKLEAYFKRTFNQSMVIKARPKKDESAEVYLGDEFLGVVFRDEEDGELSYNFSMAILDIDL